MKSTESKTSPIIKSVEKVLFSVLDKEKDNNLLLAFSAGPDSTVLLDILFRLKDKFNITVSAAYFNHCLRSNDEIEKEINIAENNCQRRNIPLFIGKDDGTIAEFSRQLGVEAAARKARYIFLNNIAEKNSCNYIAVAHNIDDNYETIIMRFFQGSGPEGLKGMEKISGNIIRPLIDVKKADILKYLEENKIIYSHDSTNKEDNYLRNRIRNNLMPAVKKVFPGYEKSLSFLSEKMAGIDEVFESEFSEKIEWIREGNCLVTNYNKFLALPAYLRVKAIYNAFNITENSGERLPYSFLKPLFSEKIGFKSPVILNGHNYRLEREGDRLFWKSDIVTINKNSYHLEIELEKEYELPVLFDKNNKKVYISSRIVKLSECAKNDIWVPVEKISGNIHIRNRNNGDFIIFEYGKKTIKKLFLEMEIDRYYRDLIPIICNNKEILAVWGSVFNYKNRVSKLVFYADKNNNKDVLLFKSRQE